MQEWLERKIVRDRKKVWMVTGVLTLSDTHITLSSARQFGLGIGGAVPLLAAAGLLLPSGDLSVGADVGGERAEGEERRFKVPDEKVFEIQLSRIRLKRGSGNGAAVTLAGDKPKWVPSWNTRGYSYETQQDEAAEKDWENEEEEDFLEAEFGEDSDEEKNLMLQSDEVEGF
ncbi:MAG: hypothetical protein Q9201_004156, partial [Fulgogasparrea decipioides]